MNKASGNDVAAKIEDSTQRATTMYKMICCDCGDDITGMAGHQCPKVKDLTVGQLREIIRQEIDLSRNTVTVTYCLKDGSPEQPNEQQP